MYLGLVYCRCFENSLDFHPLHTSKEHIDPEMRLPSSFSSSRFLFACRLLSMSVFFEIEMGFLGEEKRKNQGRKSQEEQKEKQGQKWRDPKGQNRRHCQNQHKAQQLIAKAKNHSNSVDR